MRVISLFFNRLSFFAASLMVACAAFAQPVSYLIIDGNSYDGRQVQIAARDPVNITPAAISKGGDLSIPRALDGHYYIQGYVNGFPVVFMIDTGAAVTTLPTNIARNSGIKAGTVFVSSTAGGKETGALSSGNLVKVGPYIFQDVRVLALQNLGFPILGMDVLNRFQIGLSDGVMLLRQAK